MRILLTADPELPVPPKLYGGIERVIDMLARGLAMRGHAITLIANHRSHSAGRLLPWPGSSSLSRRDTIRNAAALAREVALGGYDIVHSFSRIAYMLPILPMRIPKLMTYQRAVTRRSIQLGHRLSGGTLHFSAISTYMMRDVADIGHWHMVPNGVPLATYDFRRSVANDAPLAFLGRIEEIKGPHLAIEVARRTGLPLVIAGNIPAEHRAWHEVHVAPHIDGEHIRYIGPVGDAQKNKLLGAARAFLMPILWDEPFGIVMAEAMACGTPVIGMRRGSVPEVVADGETGFIVDDMTGMCAAVARVGTIDRSAVRDRAERLYSDGAVVGGYLDIYRRLASSR